MFELIRTRVLQLFRVPHDPDPPAGAPGSVSVFRAARNFYKLRLLGWGVGQMAALAGILFSLIFLEQVQSAVDDVRIQVRQPTAPPSSPPLAPKVAEATPPATTGKARAKSRRAPQRSLVRQIAEEWPWWLFPLLTILEAIGILLYLIQIPITYAMVRLDYELRWYIVTDRSLRIRAGIASVQETTMSFANVQQVVVSQGPVQRLLSIADLRVQSAGGGGDQHEHGGRESLHTGIFHGVDNANQIRDLILDRLRAFRQAGLGDPDEVEHYAASTPALPNAALSAAQELLQEAKALRRAIR